MCMNSFYSGMFYNANRVVYVHKIKMIYSTVKDWGIEFDERVCLCSPQIQIFQHVKNTVVVEWRNLKDKDVFLC